MLRDQAIRILRDHEAELRDRGVTRLALFGSTVRGDARGDSDVDVLVDIDQDRDFSLFDLSGLRHYLCDILGRDVEVARRTALTPFLKDNILAEAVEIYPYFGRRLAPSKGGSMPKRSPHQRLQDMLDAIIETDAFLSEKSFDDYRATVMLRKSVERNVEIISEASRHLPDDLKARHSDIPWKDIANIGDVLRHGYETVDHATPWNVATRDLSPLREAVKCLIRDVDRSEARR